MLSSQKCKFISQGIGILEKNKIVLIDISCENLHIQMEYVDGHSGNPKNSKSFIDSQWNIWTPIKKVISL